MFTAETYHLVGFIVFLIIDNLPYYFLLLLQGRANFSIEIIAIYAAYLIRCCMCISSVRIINFVI